MQKKENNEHLFIHSKLTNRKRDNESLLRQYFHKGELNLQTIRRTDIIILKNETNKKLTNIRMF